MAPLRLMLHPAHPNLLNYGRGTSRENRNRQLELRGNNSFSGGFRLAAGNTPMDLRLSHWQERYSLEALQYYSLKMLR